TPHHTVIVPVRHSSPPLFRTVVFGGAVAVALLDGIIALRMLIEIVALVVAIGNLEQRLGSALLGPFAPIPLVVCLLLFVAAIGWDRECTCLEFCHMHVTYVV